MGYNLSLYSYSLLNLREEDGMGRSKCFLRFCDEQTLKEEMILFSSLQDTLPLTTMNQFLGKLVEEASDKDAVFSTKEENEFSLEFENLSGKSRKILEKMIGEEGRFIDGHLIGGKRDSLCKFIQLSNFLPILLKGRQHDEKEW